MEEIASYKGFDASWKCRDFQYEIGQSYEHDGEIVHIRASKVGENGIKAGVWYALDENGEFVEEGEQK